MNELEGYYRTLEVEPGASLEAIRQKYLTLVKVWHPDRFTNDPSLQKVASEKLKAINVAYEKLMQLRHMKQSPFEQDPEDFWKARYGDFPQDWKSEEATSHKEPEKAERKREVKHKDKAFKSFPNMFYGMLCLMSFIGFTIKYGLSGILYTIEFLMIPSAFAVFFNVSKWNLKGDKYLFMGMTSLFYFILLSILTGKG